MQRRGTRLLIHSLHETTMKHTNLPGRIERYVEHVEETGNAYEPGDPRDGEEHELTISSSPGGGMDVWLDGDYQIPDEKLHDLGDAVAKAAAACLERRLVKAFADGYDGVDVEVRLSGTVFRPWNDSPPSYEPHSAPSDRYDFRGLTFAHLRELADPTED